jgi:hypothetical protein
MPVAFHWPAIPPPLVTDRAAAAAASSSSVAELVTPSCQSSRTAETSSTATRLDPQGHNEFSVTSVCSYSVHGVRSRKTGLFTNTLGTCGF